MRRSGTLRRIVLLLPLMAFACAYGDEASDVLDILQPMATELSDGNAAGFLHSIDKNMEGYGDLETYVVALVGSADIATSIQVISVDGDTAELDWSMRLSAKTEVGVSDRRRTTIKVRIKGKKIVSIAPIDFFRPLDARKAE